MRRPKAFTPREQIEETRKQMEEFAREMRDWEAAKDKLDSRLASSRAR
jgi:hypothetical protein